MKCNVMSCNVGRYELHLLMLILMRMVIPEELITNPLLMRLLIEIVSELDQ